MIAGTINDKYAKVIDEKMNRLGKKLEKEIKDNMEIFRGMWNFCNAELQRVAPSVGAAAGKGRAGKGRADHIPLSPPGDTTSMA